MTIKEAKAAVKAVYPKAVCCSEWMDGHWHRMVRAKRIGEPLGPSVSVKEFGCDGTAWKRAAERVGIKHSLPPQQKGFRK